MPNGSRTGVTGSGPAAVAVARLYAETSAGAAVPAATRPVSASHSSYIRCSSWPNETVIDC